MAKKGKATDKATEKLSDVLESGELNEALAAGLAAASAGATEDEVKLAVASALPAELFHPSHGRETWPERPTLDALKSAKRVLIRTVDDRSVGIPVGGEIAFPEPSEVEVERVVKRGSSFLAALATNPHIEVKIAE